ncbi:MAG TPA: aldo/keto reductase [Acidobacteriota bacterium]|nr:aldo/keto reductase [Acidobacteriota bacterium]
MQYRRLGRTNLEVSVIGFGAWGIGASQWLGATDDESMRALHKAVDLGVNFIDTALAYGDGHSEQLVGRLLRERSERIYVATKIPPRNRIWPARGSLREVYPRNYINACVEESLRNLRVESIDLIQLHVWNPQWTDQDEWYTTLKGLQEQGKVAYLGVSISEHEPDGAVPLVESGKIDTVQVIYNIFDQSPEDRLFPACRANDVGVIARVPFDEGSLTGSIRPDTTFPPGDWRNEYFRGERKREVYERVQRLTGLLGSEVKTLPELALRFCLHHPAVSSVIPGMRKVEHVVANAAVGDLPPLSPKLIEELRKHRWVRNFYA